MLICSQCNGEQPCKTCHRRGAICVYSRSIQRDNATLSGPQASLLQHQQRRMSKAIQQMASIIARLEEGAERDPGSFDVVELLDKHAPQHVVDDAEEFCPPIVSSRPTKRRKEAAPGVSDIQQGQRCGPYTQQQAPFELQPAPNLASNSGQNANQAYETMMTLLRHVNNGDARSGTASNASFSPELVGNMPAMEMSYGPDAFKSGQGAMSSDPAQYANNAPFDFMNLVDWELSLANFQSNQNFSDSNDITTFANQETNFGS